MEYRRQSDVFERIARAVMKWQVTKNCGSGRINFKLKAGWNRNNKKNKKLRKIICFLVCPGVPQSNLHHISYVWQDINSCQHNLLSSTSCNKSFNYLVITAVSIS
jgi:hypothetical protein